MSWGDSTEDPPIEDATYDRGVWVRILGPSRGGGDGTVQLQVDENDRGCFGNFRWGFHVTVSFPDAPELDQILYFSQDQDARPITLTLWVPTLEISAGGETVEAHLTTPSSELIYWNVSVDESDGEDWTDLQGPIEGQIDGTGSAVIRVRVQPNAGAKRTFTLTVASPDAEVEVPRSEIIFTQAAAKSVAGGTPQPPPLNGYSNPCQSGTPGFENWGGWLMRNGHYSTESEGRVWRYGANSGALDALNDCTGNARTFTREITHESTMEDRNPEDFMDLLADADKRVILLDTRIPTIGEYADGARPADSSSGWGDDDGWHTNWFGEGYTDNSRQVSDKNKFLLVQPLGDWGYGSKELWDVQVEDWALNDMDDETGTDMRGWEETARGNGWRLPSIQERTSEGEAAIRNHNSALWILIGGYSGSGATRQPHENSAVCGDMKDLCLFAPWSYTGNSEEGTVVAAAHTAALLDTFLLLWPDYDLLEMRNFVFECAEDMGEPGTDTRWGHGILNATCLFTPQGDLKDPRTGAIMSGGIYGPGGRSLQSRFGHHRL